MRSLFGLIGVVCVLTTRLTDVRAQSPAGAIPLLTTQDKTTGALAGWKFFCEESKAAPADVWDLDHDGVLSCRSTLRGYLATQRDYADFRLRVEWRWPDGKPGKGGVLLRKTGPDKIWPRSLEAQINAGDAGDFWGLDGYRLAGPADRSKQLVHPQFGQLSNVRKSMAAERPAGQWNQYDIVVTGDKVNLSINGQTVNQAMRCDLAPGPICLTAEGTPIQYRRVELVPTEAQ